MQERIDRVALIVQEHMNAAQEEQKRAYNHTTQPWEFQPSNRLLLLVLNTSCKFLACWQGPYTGAMNYHLQQPNKQAETQTYHINLSKKWIEPTLLICFCYTM